MDNIRDFPYPFIVGGKHGYTVCDSNGMPVAMRGSAYPGSTAELADIINRERIYAEAIRKHRDQRGDDRCWQDDSQLYSVLPEGYTPPVMDTAVELQQCKRFIECRQNPATEYVSPQRRIEELEAEVARLTALLESAKAAPTPAHVVNDSKE